jgi:hypothetical protein
MFRHIGGMVGPPKNLNALSKIEAAVRITCRDCGHAVDRALDDLSAEVREAGGSSSWPEFLLVLRCPKCEAGGGMLRATPMPFTKGRPRPQRRHALLMNLALQILRDASWRPSGVAKATIDVRLALHVLRSYLDDPKDLIEFWQRADSATPHPWESCRPLYTAIAATLIQRGHPVWVKNRP